jgi:hypothetical protein
MFHAVLNWKRTQFSESARFAWILEKNMVYVLVLLKRSFLFPRLLNQSAHTVKFSKSLKSIDSFQPKFVNWQFLAHSDWRLNNKEFLYDNFTHYFIFSIPVFTKNPKGSPMIDAKIITPRFPISLENWLWWIVDDRWHRNRKFSVIHRAFGNPKFPNFHSKLKGNSPWILNCCMYRWFGEGEGNPFLFFISIQFHFIFIKLTF